MPIRASDFKGFDYGDAVAQGQNIAYNRMRNTALSQQQEAEEERRRKRAEADEIRRQLDTMPDAIAELDRLGNFDEADRLRENYLKQMKGGVEIARTLAAGLNADNYEQVRHDMIQSGAITGDMWPTEYSEDWWANRVAREKSNLVKITRRWQDDNGYTLSQDMLARDGDVTWAGTPFESATDRRARVAPAAGATVFKFSSSDSNAIGRQVAQLYGGAYDPATERFAGLDPAQTRSVAALQAAAEELYAAGQGRITHAQAVREAAKRMRINIVNPNDALANDPAGILPQGGSFVPPPGQ